MKKTKHQYVTPLTEIILPELSEDIQYIITDSQEAEQDAKQGTFDFWDDDFNDFDGAANSSVDNGYADKDPWSKDFNDYFK